MKRKGIAGASSLAARLLWVQAAVILQVISVQGQSCRYASDICNVLQWGAWGECSSDCQGTRTREFRVLCCRRLETVDSCAARCRRSGFTLSESQTCPPKCQNGGSYNSSTSGAPCQCPNGFSGACCEKVDGQWGVWGTWSRCSVSCGLGERVRTRLCNSPAPINGGRPCQETEQAGRQQRGPCNAGSCPETTPTPGPTRAVVMTTPTSVTELIDVERRGQGERSEAGTDIKGNTTPGSDNTYIFLGAGLAATVLLLIVIVIIVVTIRRRKDAKASAEENVVAHPGTVRYQARGEPVYENSEVREVTSGSPEDSHDREDKESVKYANSDFSLSVEDAAEYDHLGHSRTPSPAFDPTYGHLDLEDGDYSHIRANTSTPTVVNDNLYGHLVADESEYDHLKHGGTQTEVLNENTYNG